MPTEVQFLLGPAGSGKTHQCISQVRRELGRSPDGLPLLFLTPKQATFQLERQILSSPDLAGYTRLQILSFERLAQFFLETPASTVPELISNEGRLMVLRSLLLQHKNQLNLFHSSATLPGFVQELSQVLHDFQRSRISLDTLDRILAQPDLPAALSAKLHDLHLLLNAYRQWLRTHHLHDAQDLLDLAGDQIDTVFPGHTQAPLPGIGYLWLDGFADLTSQETALLTKIIPLCQQVTLAFCLDEEEAAQADSWLSPWSCLHQTFRQCFNSLSEDPRLRVSVQRLPRSPTTGRFHNNPSLAHLEAHWPHPQPKPSALFQADLFAPATGVDDPEEAVRVFACDTPEDEAILAARHITRFIQAGGRYRQAAVLARRLDHYHDLVARVFRRYEIPFFLDRRQSIAHHPLAELTRSAIRLLAHNWQTEDLLRALKTGLLGISDQAMDLLENEAVTKGWQGDVWRRPLPIEHKALQRFLDRARRRAIRPFLLLEETLAAAGSIPSVPGPLLAEGLRTLWTACHAERTLQTWSAELQSQIAFASPGFTPAVHETAWDQMQAWVDNLSLAFSTDAMPLRDWLPVLEAGLTHLSVGVIPPGLDQVLVGAVDRSRNPDLSLCILLGLNEGVFPEPPHEGSLLTERDLEELENRQCRIRHRHSMQLSQERFLGYIACTRSTNELILSYARHDRAGQPLNPSLFIAHLQRLFPSLRTQDFHRQHTPDAPVHPLELLPALQNELNSNPSLNLRELDNPAFENLLAQLQERQSLVHQPAPAQATLPAHLVDQLYSPNLRLSVSRLEEFAACPFRFFVRSGLRAKERREYEIDSRRTGDFQHQVLKQFHDQLQTENLRWHDLTPADARTRIEAICQEHLDHFDHGILKARPRDAYVAHRLSEALCDFVEVTVHWMNQYQPEPWAVELRLSPDEGTGAWHLPLDDRHSLDFIGSIDRIDLCPIPDTQSALCVVMDYKSSHKTIDSIRLKNGIQMQLPLYLAAVLNLDSIRTQTGFESLVPAGIFYAPLRGTQPAAGNRLEAFSSSENAAKSRFRHRGKFNRAYLEFLDSRGLADGDQFQFKLNRDQTMHKRCTDPMPADEFQQLIHQATATLTQIGRRIYQGEIGVEPYRYKQEIPCTYCDFRAICRIELQRHAYRSLTATVSP